MSSKCNHGFSNEAKVTMAIVAVLIATITYYVEKAKDACAHGEHIEMHHH